MPNDAHLQLSVLAELEWEPSITAAHIGVAANGGIRNCRGRKNSTDRKGAFVARPAGCWRDGVGRARRHRCGKSSCSYLSDHVLERVTIIIQEKI